MAISEKALGPEHPKVAVCLNNLAMIYQSLGDYTKAEQLYKRAVEIQPAYEKAYYNLGNVYRVREDYDRAVTMYQKAAQLNPDNFKNHNNHHGIYHR